MDKTDEKNDFVGLAALAAAATKATLKARKVILKNAKTKKAQKIADAGGYNTLTDYQKSLIAIPDTTTTEAEPVVSVNAVPKSATQTETKETVSQTQNTSTPVTESKIKKYIPMIIGIIVIGLLGWLIFKKR